MYILNSNDKNSLLSIKEVFEKQIEFEKLVKEKIQDKIDEINNMRTYVVDTGWLFRDLVEETTEVLNNIKPYPQYDCKKFNDFAKMAIICLTTLQSKPAKDNVKEYLNLIDDLMPVATREQMLDPLEKYLIVCDVNVKYFEKQVSKINNILDVNQNKGMGKE